MSIVAKTVAHLRYCSALVFTGRMLFLVPKQQYQSIEGKPSPKRSYKGTLIGSHAWPTELH